MKIGNLSERPITAWLVTWEFNGERARPKKRVAAVLRPTRSEEIVKDLIEVLYSAEMFTTREKINWARGAFDPFPAELHEVEGFPFFGGLTCGDNPSLLARKVYSLQTTDLQDEDQLRWLQVLPPSAGRFTRELGWMKLRDLGISPKDRVPWQHRHRKHSPPPGW